MIDVIQIIFMEWRLIITLSNFCKNDYVRYYFLQGIVPLCKNSYIGLKFLQAIVPKILPSASKRSVLLTSVSIVILADTMFAVFVCQYICSVCVNTTQPGISQVVENIFPLIIWGWNLAESKKTWTKNIIYKFTNFITLKK